MNYHDFDKHVHTLILESGWDYFDKGFVENLEETPSGWKAQVKGQQDYKVVLSGTQGLEAWICDCPYDHGPVCKHVAATLYAVKDKISTALATRLSELNEEQLRNVIIAGALDHREFNDLVKSLLD